MEQQRPDRGQPPAPPNQERLAEFRLVTPGYFPAFGDRLVRGRLLDDKAESPSSPPVVVVNERFVDRFIPNGTDPIGQAIQDGRAGTTIVGVVRNIRQSIYSRPLAETDYPVSQIPLDRSANYLATMDLVVRTAGAPEGITQDLRRTFAALDKTLPFRTPKTMDDVIAGAITLERLENWLFGCFAGLALVLALIGLYGLISHEVELSRHDIGIRMAIGASRFRILPLAIAVVAPRSPPASSRARSPRGPPGNCSPRWWPFSRSVMRPRSLRWRASSRQWCRRPSRPRRRHGGPDDQPARGVTTPAAAPPKGPAGRAPRRNPRRQRRDAEKNAAMPANVSGSVGLMPTSMLVIACVNSSAAINPAAIPAALSRRP